MARTQHVVELPQQTPRRFRDGAPVLHIDLPREVTAPEEFEDVDLIPAGEREVVPTGLAPLSDVLKTGFGLLSLVGVMKRNRSRQSGGNDASAPTGV
jgi:hypothetical protein